MPAPAGAEPEGPSEDRADTPESFGRAVRRSRLHPDGHSEPLSCVSGQIPTGKSAQRIQPPTSFRFQDLVPGSDEGDESACTELRLAQDGRIVSRCRRRALELTGSQVFDIFMGAIILLNAATIGIDQSLALQGKEDSKLMDVVDTIFALIYISELFLRYFAMGPRAMRDVWIRFDTTLVAIDILVNWVLFAFIGEVKGLEFLNALRLLKLLRLARAMKILVRFRDLWIMVRGLTRSGGMMVYTFFLLFVILYIFSCISIEIITKHHLAVDSDDFDPEFREHVLIYFASIPDTMLTLMQFVYFDSIAAVYRPLVLKDWKLAWFFVAVNLVVGIVLMNLVTAVVVNSALEEASSDKEMVHFHEEAMKKKLIKKLYDLFHRVDVDQSGQITLEEFQNISDEDKEILNSLMPNTSPDHLFQALDVEGDGELQINEFCDGVWEVVISNTPLEIKRTGMMMDIIKKKLGDIGDQQALIWKQMQQERDQFWAILSQDGFRPAMAEKPFASHPDVNGGAKSAPIPARGAANVASELNRSPTVADAAVKAVPVLQSDDPAGKSQAPAAPHAAGQGGESAYSTAANGSAPTSPAAEDTGGSLFEAPGAADAEHAELAEEAAQDAAALPSGDAAAPGAEPRADQAPGAAVPREPLLLPVAARPRTEEASREPLQASPGRPARKSRSRGGLRSPARSARSSSSRRSSRRAGDPLAQVPASGARPLLLRPPPSPRNHEDVCDMIALEVAAPPPAAVARPMEAAPIPALQVGHAAPAELAAQDTEEYALSPMAFSVQPSLRSQPAQASAPVHSAPPPRSLFPSGTDFAVGEVAFDARGATQQRGPSRHQRPLAAGAAAAGRAAPSGSQSFPLPSEWGGSPVPGRVPPDDEGTPRALHTGFAERLAGRSRGRLRL